MIVKDLIKILSGMDQEASVKTFDKNGQNCSHDPVCRFYLANTEGVS